MNYNNEMFSMEVIEKQVNLELLHDIISFVSEATNKNDIWRHIKNDLLFDNKRLKGSNIQEKYGFRYLGELLERFEERYGSDPHNIRAIALALALTYELLSNDLFVGKQKEDFVNKIKALSKFDIYFKGALYLIQLYEGEEATLYSEFINATYSKTENLIFALSLFDDFETNFALLRKQIHNYIGKAKTIPVIGNERIYGWLIKKLAPLSKKLRDKEAALFKALAALPVSFVNEEKPQYSKLIENGYSREEIVYLNYALIHMRPVPDTVSTITMVGEKIAVEFFLEYINSEATHAATVYELLKMTLELHAKFKIKCYGYEGILEAVEDKISLANADTFCFLFNNIQNKYKRFFEFDVLNPKWDALVNSIDTENYLCLFDSLLRQGVDFSKEDIAERIRKYDSLTNSSYIASFESYSYSRADIFSFLVKKEVLNLVELYTKAINRADDKCENNESCIDFIRKFIEGIRSKEAYEFIKYLFENYILEEIEENFNGNFDFEREMFHGQSNYFYSSRKTIDIERSFLTEDENRQIFYWLDDFMFNRRVNKYSEFIQCVLDSEYIESLFTKNKLCELFNTIMSINPAVLSKNIHSYKNKFLSAEELQAERDKEAQEELEARQNTERELNFRIKSELAASAEAGFKELYETVDKYRWRDKELRLSYELLSSMLDDIFTEIEFKLQTSDIPHLFKLLGGMYHNKKITLAKIQEIIARIQGVEQYAENTREDTACLNFG